MKHKLSFIYLATMFLIYFCSYSQTDKVKLVLNDSVSLQLERVKFDSKEHQIEYYKNWIVAIDGRPYFGSDGEMPRHQLSKAILKINDNFYYLETDAMYNPWNGNQPNESFYRLEGYPNYYTLNASFSDGAGYYVAEWLITGKSSIRTILTNDEAIIECLEK